VGIRCSSPSLYAQLAEACAEEGWEARPLSEGETWERDADIPLDLALIHANGDDPDWAERTLGLPAARTFQGPLIVVVTSSPAPSEWVARTLVAGADDVGSLDAAHRDELKARMGAQLRNKRYRDAIERLRKAHTELKSRSTMDSLTGALGRGAIEVAIQSELSANVAFAVLFADVDHFKSVNDTYGHQMGDRVLKDVAGALNLGCRAGDACGRYGGEEFVLLLRGVNREQAIRVAERHRAAVERLRFAEANAPNQVTISVGIAVFEPDAPDPSVASLLSRADAALYRAKHEGRNRVAMARPMPPPASASGLRPSTGGSMRARASGGDPKS
jgi:diguanylate cyclase (GGDEF)-like protein